MEFIVVDCETKKHFHQVEGGWNNIEAMELSTAVTYSSELDRYVFWTGKQKDELCKYLNGQVVVSFNGILFDTKLLLGNDRRLNNNGSTENDKYKWINADIYVEMWRHIFDMDGTDYNKITSKIEEQKFPKDVFGLDDIAYTTIKKTKSGKGSIAPDLYQQNRILELFQYNLQDVRVTKELYLFIKKYRYLVSGSYDIVSFDG